MNLSQILDTGQASSLVDDEHGYIITDVSVEEDTARLLVVLGRNNVEEWNQVMMVTLRPEDWDDYYPIVRAIVESLRALDGTQLGFELPETVS